MLNELDYGPVEAALYIRLQCKKFTDAFAFWASSQVLEMKPSKEHGCVCDNKHMKSISWNVWVHFEFHGILDSNPSSESSDVSQFTAIVSELPISVALLKENLDPCSFYSLCVWIWRYLAQGHIVWQTFILIHPWTGLAGSEIKKPRESQ